VQQLRVVAPSSGPCRALLSRQHLVTSAAWVASTQLSCTGLCMIEHLNGDDRSMEGCLHALHLQCKVHKHLHAFQQLDPPPPAGQWCAKPAVTDTGESGA
jgi:hypothetical protein